MGLSTVSAFKHINGKKLSDKQLKKLQLVLTDITSDIDSFCKKNKLIYNLGGGSCLGAVRHDGFIPWDDDMDLDIPRKDYDYLLKHFTDEYGKKYFVSNYQTERTGIAFSRIRKNGTVFKSREDRESENPGIYVDIFPIENTYNFAVFRFMHGLLSMAYGFLASCKNFFANRREYLKLANGKKMRLIFRIKIIIGAIIFWRSPKSIVRTWDKINSMCHNDKSKYVVVPVGRKHFFGELYLRSDFCETIDHKFENKTFKICRSYDSYLKHMYGDYMKIPKKEDRETHVFFELDFGDMR